MLVKITLIMKFDLYSVVSLSVVKGLLLVFLLYSTRYTVNGIFGLSQSKKAIRLLIIIVHSLTVKTSFCGM